MCHGLHVIVVRVFLTHAHEYIYIYIDIDCCNITVSSWNNNIQIADTRMRPMASNAYEKHWDGEKECGREWGKMTN